jgi:hypothetical protein
MNLHDIEKITQEIKQLQEELNKKSKTVLEESLSTFLKETPEISSISWCQYIPGFNDGEACEFSRTDINFALADLDANPDDEDDEDDEDLDDEGVNPFEKPRAYVYEHKHEKYYNDLILEYEMKVKKYGETRFNEVATNIEYIKKLINAIPENTLEGLYGVNVKIKITKDKTTTDDWDCGH